TTKLSKVSRGSSGEPPCASWLDATWDAKPRGSAPSALAWLSRAGTTGSDALAAAQFWRITAERTTMSIRRNAALPACQYSRTFSPECDRIQVLGKRGATDS